MADPDPTPRPFAPQDASPPAREHGPVPPPAPEERPPDPGTDPAPGSSPEPAPRLLRRSASDQMIAGVAAGIGRYVGIDPVLLRLGFVLLTLAGGSGILLYLVAAAVIPREGPGESAGEASTSTSRAFTRVVGWALLATGAVLLVGRFVPGLEQVVWPIAILGLGAMFLVQGSRRD